MVFFLGFVEMVSRREHDADSGTGGNKSLNRQVN